jgi:glycosyltransferase involved in cell wall biosynthesis
MSNLILFTQTFPCYGGEQFLETEIDYLADAFDNVFVVPFRGAFNGTQLRRIPKNVAVIDEIATYPKTKLRYLLSGLLQTLRSPAVASEIVHRPEILVKLKYALRLLVAEYEAGIIRRWLVPQLNNYNPNNTLLYSYWASSSAYALASVKENGWQGPAITRAHGSDIYEKAIIPPFLPYWRFILDHLDLIIVISRHGRDYLERRYGKRKAQVAISRLGTRDPKSAALSSNDGILRIVSCSYLVCVKRVDSIIAALKQLASRLPANIKHEFSGEMTNKQLHDYYKQNIVDLFVNFSASEGIPVSIMEAMSYSVPVIATDVGGVSEIVNQSNGYLLSPSSKPTELAQVINKFARLNMNDRKLLRYKARQTWTQYYDANTNYSAFVRMLKDMISE